MRLEGPGGTTRSSTIHGMLWTYLRGMIERVVWAQEQFGGGFCGAGGDGFGEGGHGAGGQSPEVFRSGGLRTLGSVEA